MRKKRQATKESTTPRSRRSEEPKKKRRRRRKEEELEEESPSDGDNLQDTVEPRRSSRARHTPRSYFEEEGDGLDEMDDEIVDLEEQTLEVDKHDPEAFQLVEIHGHDLSTRRILATYVSRWEDRSIKSQKIEKEWICPFREYQDRKGLEQIGSYLRQRAKCQMCPATTEGIRQWIDDINLVLRKNYFKDPPPLSQYAFCCAKCKHPFPRPSISRGNLCWSDTLGVVRSGDDRLYHRFCCHEHDFPRETDIPDGSEWRSPVEIAQQQAQCRSMIPKDSPDPEDFWMADLQASIENGGEVPIAVSSIPAEWYRDKSCLRESWVKGQEMELGLQPEPEASISEPVQKKESVARKLPTSLGGQQQNDGAVVLDLTPLGSGIVAMKKLGIAMTKIIFAQSDLVARYILESHHSHDLGNCELVFEDLQGDSSSLKQHYPGIDIVVGPCKMDILRAIAEANQDVFPYFICELDDTSGIKDFCDVEAIETSILSPCLQSRELVFNYPVEEPQKPRYQACASRCLDEGWITLAMALGVDEARTGGCFKTNSLTGCPESLNDLRMLVVEKDGSGFGGRVLNAGERERILGLWPNYAAERVEKLFDILYTKGMFQEMEYDCRISNWRMSLAKQLHCFSGERFEYYLVEDKGQYQVKIRMNPAGLKNCFFDSHDYTKFLVGQSYSIPVLEHLMAPLKPLFGSCDYDRYPFKYAWEFSEPKHDASDPRVKADTEVKDEKFAASDLVGERGAKEKPNRKPKNLQKGSEMQNSPDPDSAVLRNPPENENQTTLDANNLAQTQDGVVSESKEVSGKRASDSLEPMEGSVLHHPADPDSAVLRNAPENENQTTLDANSLAQTQDGVASQSSKGNMATSVEAGPPEASAKRASDSDDDSSDESTCAARPKGRPTARQTDDV